jgi:hypothetical protein
MPIYAYSYAQYPMEWFPSGSCNHSRMDGTTFDINLPRTDALGNKYGEADVLVYCEYFNFLKFSRGQIHIKFA